MENNNRAIDPVFIRIRNIANGSDDAIGKYINTPIYEILIKRRYLARQLDKKLLTINDVEMFNMFDNEIKQHLSIN